VSDFNLTDIVHGSAEWHDIRRKAITGTDLAAVLGLPAYRTALDIYYRVLELGGGRVDEENAFMRWGNVMEPVAAQQFEVATGMPVDLNSRLAIHPDIPYLMGSPDGFVTDPMTGEVCIWEGKAPSFYTRDQWAPGVCPEHYIHQVEAYLAICGLRRGFVCALMPPAAREDDLTQSTEVIVTDERRREIEDAVRSWWQRHIIDEVEPVAVSRDESFLRELHPDDEPRTVTLPIEEAGAYVAAKTQADTAKDAEKAAKARLIQRMGSAAWGSTEDGAHAFSFRTNKRGVRSLRAIPQLPKAAPSPEVKAS